MLYATTVMDAGKSPSNRRLTVKEAAKRLNTSEAAMRQRIQRGSIDHEKDEETGRVFVILSEDDLGDEPLNGDETKYETGYERELIDTLREQLAAEREANRENRRIIAALASRIPEIEAPAEPRESPVSSSEATDKGTAPLEQQEPIQRRSWWRTLFGLE
jgi:hypothetical protein